MVIVMSLFSFSFLNCFSSTLQRKAGVYKFLLFEERFRKSSIFVLTISFFLMEFYLRDEIFTLYTVLIRILYLHLHLRSSYLHYLYLYFLYMH